MPKQASVSEELKVVPRAEDRLIKTDQKNIKVTNAERTDGEPTPKEQPMSPFKLESDSVSQSYTQVGASSFEDIK